MPQRKKGNNKKNNKKNKPGFYGNPPKKGAARKAKQPTTSSSSSSSNNAAGSCFQGQKPSNLKEYIDRRRQGIKETYPSFYMRYKEATRRFMDYMIQETPDYVEGNRKSVDFIVVAANWMEQTNVQVNPSILNDLKLSIRMRSRAAKSVYGGGDAGHAHLLSCLVYCWTVLVSLPRLTNDTTTQKEAEEEARTKQTANRFELMEDDDYDEMDDDIFPSSPVSPPEPKPDIAMTIEQLMTADDRNDIILFLLTLDELMGSVISQYEALARNLPHRLSQNIPITAMVEETIEGAVATNMAIQVVQQLEFDFQQQHPHLSTSFRMLSTLVLPEITQHLTQIVREHSSTSTSNLEKEIAIFLGDCLEYNFRSPSDPMNKSETVVEEFCTKLNVNEYGTSEIKNFFRAITLMVIQEAPFYCDMQNIRSMQRTAQSNSLGGKLPKQHAWISKQNMPNIGGDRSIIHTLRLLQSFSAVISGLPHDKRLEPKRGFFGPSPWRAGRAQKIHGDLDELFMSDILPQWVLMCRNGVVGQMELPRENDILPLFVLMRQFVKDPEKPVSWSLTFAIHAMLTSILETDRIFDKTTDLFELVFNNYFHQLDNAVAILKNENDTDLPTNKIWPMNMLTVTFLQNFGLDTFGNRALWNPLCAGTTFSYLCFFGNLEAGCTLIDCEAQLRITLHLFHALKINNIIQEDQIPLLDKLHKCFQSSRGVWEGPLPKKGEFVQRFWICFGMNAKNAKKMADKSKLAVQKHQLEAGVNKDDWGKRKMKAIEPAEIAKCYRRICNRDFHDVVDKYHTDEQRRKSKGTEMYSYACRSNDTLDAIDEEQPLLSLNLPACGIFLEQFVCSLGRILQWGPFLNSGNAYLDSQKRQGFAVLFAQHLLGALDFADDPFSHEFLNVPMGEASATFMNGFFNRLDPGRVLWFQAVEHYD